MMQNLIVYLWSEIFSRRIRQSEHFPFAVAISEIADINTVKKLIKHVNEMTSFLTL